MKFEYDKDKQETRECVAYIGGDGALRVKADGGVTHFHKHGVIAHGHLWRPDGAIHKFYAGDSVTITF